MAQNRQVTPQTLQEKSKRSSIIDLFVGGFTPSEIAETLECSREYVEKVIAETDSDLSFTMMELAEKVAIINLARIERLVKAYFPLALSGSVSAGEIAVKLMKLEVEWADRIIPKKDEDTPDVAVVEKFEQTLTASSPLYDIAQTNLEEDWLSMGDVPVEEIYKVIEHVTVPEGLQDDIARLEAKLNAKETPSDDDDEPEIPTIKPKRGRGRPRKNQ